MENELESYCDAMEFFEAMESQRELKIVRLNRNDLILANKTLDISDINIYSFKTPLKEFWEADEVVFWDDDKAFKILKQR